MEPEELAWSLEHRFENTYPLVERIPNSELPTVKEWSARVLVPPSTPLIWFPVARQPLMMAESVWNPSPAFTVASQLVNEAPKTEYPWLVLLREMQLKALSPELAETPTPFWATSTPPTSPPAPTVTP